jgi:hypothetical protein
MKMKYANSRKAEGRWHFRNDQQGGLGSRWNIGCQDIFENAGFPSVFKNFGVSVQMQFERNLVLIAPRTHQSMGTGHHCENPIYTEFDTWP